MLRRNLIHCVWVLAVVFTAASCRSSEENSNTRYLSVKSYKCFEHPSERIEAVRKKLPEGFLSKNYGSSFETALNRVAGIPDPYIDHLIDRYKTRKFKGIYPSSLGGSVAGLTQLQSEGPDGSIMFATSITTTVSDVGFALQHEIGHAIEGVIRQENINQRAWIERNFNTLHLEAKSHPEVRSYAKSNPTETWAEAFANFYCSPESLSFIEGDGANRQYFSRSKEFLRKVLLPPLWQTPNSPQPPDPSQSNQLYVRFDPASPNAQTPWIEISAPSQTTTLFICENLTQSRDCNANHPTFKKIDAPAAVAEGRAFFKTLQINWDNANMKQIVILAQNASAQDIAQRAIVFEKIR